MTQELIDIGAILPTLEDWSARFEIAVDVFKQAIDYLKYYGYLADNNALTVQALLEAIKKFQELYGIFVDGVLNPKTIRAMTMPRCCLTDLPAIEEARRSNYKWAKTELTYYISGYDSDISRSDWDNSIRMAFNYWSEVTPLRFTKVASSDRANFILGVGTGRKNNFDGPSGTLAWFQLPPNSNYNGQLKGMFDSAESWNRDVLLVNVACHEIGHGLGLEHSKVKTALMAPFYSRSVARPQPNDDISRIQALYGKNVAGTPVPIPEPLPDDHQMTILLNGSISIPGYRIQKMG